jgi:hypothetical protein
METNWIQEMIEREALPKATREGTVAEFCVRWGITESTYYYQSSKPDNWKKTLEISLNNAKKECPEILKVLSEKAKSGDVKAIDMYLNYIVQLAKNLDIKSDGKVIAGINYVIPNNNNPEAQPETA